ncbi:uncharacterized protein LOC128657631 [Bombina bombina]|uniref:uncharacterized protein LOC128657631 n=1 Tax=Bombina bombina TaxID=8345 RepID=UPI00235AE0B6|nr:uncharacterized protein LOC128657631 [Bombina bombina]
MDERHWWIAGKVHETLQTGAEEDTTAALEALFLQAENLQLINRFLQAKGHPALFFFVDTKENGNESKWQLHLKSDLLSLESLPWKTHFPTVLYFLRSETTHDIDAATMEREIFYGEIKENPVESLISLLNELYIPVLRAQKDWGSCSQASVTHFLSGLEKYVTAIEDATNTVKSEKHQILRRPHSIVNPDFLQPRSAILDSEIIGENEALVSEWIKTIDQILSDAVDERVLDITTTPLTELDRWHRRQKVLGLITEQLRGKECKTVIGLLISAKSRLLKKWKTVDISITDAANAAKDRVKYLEALYRHLDALATDNDPISLTNSIIPALFNGIRQMENMSRLFAKNGYLGLLLTKVSNQLAQNCRTFLREAMTYSESEDKLWDKIREYMETSEDEINPLVATQDEKQIKKEKFKLEIIKNSNVYARIQSCLAVYASFQEAVYQLRDWLVGGGRGTNRYSSFSSISTVPGKLSSLNTVKSSKVYMKKPPSVSSSYDHQHDYQCAGVALTDDDTIMYHMDALCIRLRQICDIIVKLKEFKRLAKLTEGLRKPAQEDIIEDDESDCGSVCETPVHDERKEKGVTCNVDYKNEFTASQAGTCRENQSPGKSLHTLIEEEEAQISAEDSFVLRDLKVDNEDLCNNEIHSLQSDDELPEKEEDTEFKLSNEEKHILDNLYNLDELEDEESTMSSVLLRRLEQMIDMLAQYIDSDVLLDTDKRDHNPCEEGYSEFLVMNQETEKFISVYIQALFLRKMPTTEALSILRRFSVVSDRPGIQPIINECYMEVFDWFYEELKEVQQQYETYKDDPVLPRNVPPTVGAIIWSRKLFLKIEKIMKIFKDIRILTTSLSYSTTVKLYNRIATALVGYEDLWYQKWKAQVDKRLSGLNFALLVRDPNTQQIKVNTDLRVIHLFEETKWLMRLGINVPQAAMQALQQAEKFKMYKSDLEDVVQEYQKLQNMIPQNLALLFTSHLERLNHQFQPGLSTLSWSSVNIEGLLHQANAAVKRLRTIIKKVTEIKEQVIEQTLEKIYCLDLLPFNEITNSPKSPDGLIQISKLFLLEKKAELESMIATIKSAFSDIIKILESTQDNQNSLQNINTASISKFQKPSRKSQSLTSSNNSCNIISEEISNQVLGSLSDEVCHAVYSCICRSLLHLAHLVGCDLESFSMELLNIFNKQKEKNPETQDATRSLWETKHYLGKKEFLTPLDLWPHSKKGELCFQLLLTFKIPRIVVNPPVKVAEDATKQVGLSILNICDSLSWCSEGKTRTPFHVSIAKDELLQHILNSTVKAVNDWESTVKNQVFSLSSYDFLWTDDMYRQSEEIVGSKPDLSVIHKEVKRFLHIEEKIKEYPEVLRVGCMCLDFSSIKETLKGFAGSWKSHYATILHHHVKVKLQEVLQYREQVWQQLTVPVQSLEQLNYCLILLEELQDMENKIDNIYQPIEDMYEQLRSYQLRIPREEVTEVTNLRSKWAELLNLSDTVKEELLKEKLEIFKQELDKQVKSFVVEVIQFRNSFDTQGPAAPGVMPEEAVARLHDFKEKFQVYDDKRKTLNSVQRRFNIIPKIFPELDRTGKDLHLLGTLYILFQKFLDFDQRFRNTLWAEVDLTLSNAEIAQYWSECLVWNEKLKDWDAYNEMAREIKFYDNVFPLLHKLNSKEIRNRHWLQVMAATGSSFPLEANVFKVSHLLDIGLLKYQKELISIAKAAQKEMEVEIKMRKVEEEWTEQVLTFSNYKNRGPIYLVEDDALRLLEGLEDAQVLLAQMLTSKEIDPLREEATTWAEKLKRVGNVLELWIEVQELWQHLEEIFSHFNILKELPREARRFAKADRSWTRMMRSSFNTKNVLQCCCGGDVPKEAVLRHILQELEICFCSLASYLDRMRQTFSRFYFLSDSVLLSVLSRPRDVKRLQVYLRSLFGGVSSIDVVEQEEEETGCSEEEPVEVSGPITDFLSIRSGNEGWLSLGQRSTTHITDNETIFQRSLKSAGVSHEKNQPLEYKEPQKSIFATAVKAFADETLQLDEQVTVTPDVGAWLSKLQNTISKSLNNKIYQVMEDIHQGMTVEEWTQKYPAQVALLGLLYLWTCDCESYISEMKQDRKAMSATLKKYSSMVTRLSFMSSKGQWKSTSEPISQSERLKLENMITQILYLRDTMDGISSRKIREVTDFDWKRVVRFYLKENSGTLKHEINIFDAKYIYGCEFYGTRNLLIMNSVTERSFLKISQMLQQVNGVILQGDCGVGKTETVKGLSYLLGTFLFLFTCSSTPDASALSRILKGTSHDRCWSCFDDFHLLSKEAVSVFMHSAQALYDSLKTKLPRITLQDEYKVCIGTNCSVFLTICWRPGFQDLPSDVRAVFRTVSLVAPDNTALLKAKLTSLGFKSPKALATRLHLVSELLKEQLAGEFEQCFSFQSMTDVLYWACQRREAENGSNGQMNHVDLDGGRFSRASSITAYASPAPSVKTPNSNGRNKKSMSSNPVLAAAKESHVLIAEALHDIIGPRMTGDSALVFKQIVRDVFMGMCDPSGVRQMTTKEFEKAVLVKIEENKWSPHSPWLNKVNHLFNLSMANPGVIVAGPPGSGKSSCITALVQALNHLQLSVEDPAHKLVKINPLTVDSSTSMFGTKNNSGIWEDGIVTYVWKRALQSHRNTWMWLDGHLSSSWADNFNSVLGTEKVLQLRNGDRLEFPKHMRLLFETTDLQLASPATLTKAGVLYIESEALGWRPLAKVWLDGRNQQENAVLSKAFYKTLDPIFNLILHDIRPLVPVTEVGLFHTCTSLLTVMLNDKAQSIGGQLHIERLFIFCLIWSMGALIEMTERRKFSELLKVYTSVLPDDEQEISVFDYYLDESGEWDTWQSRLPEMTYIGSTDMMGEVFVETQDTMIVRTFLEYACMGSQHVLLTGPPGCGKTALMNDFISTQDRARTLLKRMVFSGSSKAKGLQELLEQNIVNRQGNIYGARDGKNLKLFIDDINLPTSNDNGVQCCNELLRMVLDDKTLVRLNKPFEWQLLEGIIVQAAMRLPKYPSKAQTTFYQRLLRHFAIFHLPDLEGSQLQQVIFSVLEANMGDKEGFPLQEELNLSIVRASYKVLDAIKGALVPSSTPGREHYQFSLREINKTFQSLRKLSNEDREDRGTVVEFWQHEMHRVIQDRLCRQTDINWFNSELKNTIQEYFPDILIPSEQKWFTTIPMEMKFAHQANTGNKVVKALLQSINKLDDVRNYLQTIVQHYNEELGHQKLQIEISENIVIKIIRIHRVLSSENGGNVLLVGCVGSHLSTLVKLALYVADVPLHSLDTTGINKFTNSLKSAIQISAVEGKPTAILLTASELVTENYLDAINSLLICGEYPALFTTEEMNDLLQVLGPSLRRKHPHLSYDPAKYLVSQVKSYLHIMICLSPTHRLLKTASRKYPGFINGCQLIWVDSWSHESINKDARYYIMQQRIMESYHQETRENVARAISLIHSYMLQNNNQIPWAGNYNQNMLSNEDLGQADEINQINFPYCREIIQERIKILLSEGTTAVNERVFIGPSTLETFLENFNFVLRKKMEEQEDILIKLKGATDTLARSRSDAKETQETIKILRKEYKEAEEIVEGILNKLITKTSILERFKAELGVGDKNLQIFLSQNENESDNYEADEDLLKDDSFDEYDDAFKKMKEASKKSYLNEILQKIEKARNDLEDAIQSLKHSKSQVMHWCSKVDKNCIERLVRCQNPPYLVAQILEMALVMVDCLPKADNTNVMPKSAIQSLDNAAPRFQPSPAGKSSQSKRGMRDLTDKVDRGRWKNLLYHIGETSKFVDMIHQIAKLEDGLPDETLKTVEKYLGKTRDGFHGVTGEGSLLENAAPHATPQSITPAKKYSHSDKSKPKDGITIATARYSSEDAASLVAFVVAIVEYTQLCVPLKECLQRMTDLEKEKEELSIREELSKMVTETFEEDLPVSYQETLSSLTAEDLPTLQAEVAQLHGEYDAAVVHKHQLEAKLQSHQERLKAALDMLERLKTQENEWKEMMNQNSVTDLLTNCLLAAAFLTYCSALSVSRRIQVTEFFFKVCESRGLPMPHRMLLKDLPLVQFLHTPIELKILEIKGLPVNSLALDNSCIFTYTKENQGWVLVCDPTGQAIDWIKGHLPEDTTCIMHHHLVSELDTCLTDGLPLLLTYCDIQALSRDLRFTHLLHSKRKFQQHKVPFKMMVAEHEVECNPGFRVYLHSTCMPEDIPPEVASYCNILYFYQDREGLLMQLLDRFVQQEKPRLKEEHSLLKQEQLNNMMTLSALEEKIITILKNDGSLLQNLSTTKKLCDLKLQHEEALEMNIKIAASEQNLLHAREGFREVAVRGSVMFDTARVMHQLNNMYDTSFSQLMGLFDLSVAHSERYSIRGVVTCVTSNIFSYVSRSLLEKDRIVYALLVSFEVEHSLGRMKPGEREFAISPDLSVSLMQRLGRNASVSRQQLRNPLDWMTEEQFKNLQILATYFDWFGEIFDRMCKDIKDTTWKTFCESEQPENPSYVKWPEGLEDLSPHQRFLVLRAVRIDRILPAASNYINAVLGKIYKAESSGDIKGPLAWMAHDHPCLLIYDKDNCIPRALLLDLAKKRNQKISVYPISLPEDKAEEVILHGMAEGLWILLENVQNSLQLMMSLEKTLKLKKNPDKNFRLWMSVQASQNLPARLFHYTIKTVVDTPMNIKSGMIHSWQLISHETLGMSTRPEWPVVLHNLCFLHCAIRLRTLYGASAGWNYPNTMRLGCTELMDAVQLLKDGFKEDELETGTKVIPWSAIRNYLAEVIYGSNISDELDMTTMMSMIDYWINPNSTKKDYDLTKLKYRVPAAFFNSDLNFASLAQALEAMPQHLLNTPEVFHMHPSPQVSLGQECYLFSQLEQLYRSVSQHRLWTYTIVKNPPTSQEAGVKPALVSPTSNQELALLATYSISNVHATNVAGLQEVKEMCSSLLSKVPRGWNRDFIYERLKKLGGSTPFNLFFKKELDHFMSYLSEIRRNVQDIKHFLESPETLGDQLSETCISILNDLYHKRAPAYWCTLVWSFSCPSDWPVTSWINDLQQRFAHFEKLLQLGREKMPTYWLGAFKNPKGLLSVLKQEAVRRLSERNGNAELVQFKTEMTQRDKEHIRDPPHDGMFIYGVHIWGVFCNKTDAEILDSPPKQSISTLPVIHLRCLSLSDKSGIGDAQKSLETYICPVYLSSTSAREPVFSLDIHKENIASSRWSLRGMKATIHPF